MEKESKDLIVPVTNTLIAQGALDQIAQQLTTEAFNDLRDEYHARKIDPTLVIQTCLGAQKVAVDTEYRRMRLKQERDGTLTPEEAAQAARDFVDGLCGAIETVAQRHGIDGAQFLQEVLLYQEQIEKEAIFAKAKLAQERKSDE